MPSSTKGFCSPPKWVAGAGLFRSQVSGLLEVPLAYLSFSVCRSTWLSSPLRGVCLKLHWESHGLPGHMVWESQSSEDWGGNLGNADSHCIQQALLKHQVYYVLCVAEIIHQLHGWPMGRKREQKAEGGRLGLDLQMHSCVCCSWVGVIKILAL